MTSARDLAAAVAGFSFAFASSWRMSLVIFAFMPPIAAIASAISVLVGRETKRYHEAVANSNKVAHETFAMICTVMAYCGQEGELGLYRTALDQVFACQVKRVVISAFATGLLMLVIVSCFSTGFWFGSLFVAKGLVSLSGAIAASSIVPAVFAAVRLANDQKRFAAASVAARSVLEVIQSQSKIDALAEGGITPEHFQGGLTFQNVNFEYQTKPQEPNESDGSLPEGQHDLSRRAVLSGFNLDILPCSSHAICGPSGCGKSTILSLIGRHYDVSNGQILLDGTTDNRDVNTQWLRSQIGHVHQNPTLFQGTILENIEYGVPFSKEHQSGKGKEPAYRTVPFEDIISAAKVANAHDFIEKLPNGYDTHIGEGGALLSGGQKQRICIARAIVRKPKILLLDESTASLDSENEALVQNAIERASKNQTTITVAHNMRIVSACDTISVVSNGRVAEQGNHEQLMQLSEGMYKSMVEVQLSSGGAMRKEDDVSSSGAAVFKQRTSGSSRMLMDDIESVETSELVSEDKLDRLQKLVECDEKLESELSEYLKTALTRRVFSLQKPESLLIGLGIFHSTIAGAAWPLAAACISELLHVGPASDKVGEVRKWLLLLLGCGIAAFVGIVGQNILLSVSGERLSRRVRSSYFSLMLARDMSFFDRKENTPGLLALKLSYQAGLLRGLTGDSLGCFMVTFASISTGATIALYYCWRVALVGLIFMPGILLSGVG